MIIAFIPASTMVPENKLQKLLVKALQNHSVIDPDQESPAPVLSLLQDENSESYVCLSS